MSKKKWKKRAKRLGALLKAHMSRPTSLSSEDVGAFVAHVERSLAAVKDAGLSEVAHQILADFRMCSEFHHANAADLLEVYRRVSLGPLLNKVE